MEALFTGDRVEITFLDDPARPLEATICSALSDRQEGLGPEIEDYVACWLEVSLGTCEGTQQHRSILFSTDSRYSMDGRELTLRKLQHS